MSERVARSRELVARGGKPAVVARVMQISRQATYRTPARRPAKARRQGPPGQVDRAIVEVALDNRTDGYRMVAALVARKLGEAVNRKRVVSVIREQRLIQRRRPLDRPRRPGYFSVSRPDEPSGEQPRRASSCDHIRAAGHVERRRARARRGSAGRVP